MFVDEIKLLACDILKEFIDLSRLYLNISDGENARKCFVTAETLEIHANNADNLHSPFREHLNMLQSSNGLIRQSQITKKNQMDDETTSICLNMLSLRETIQQI
ncbi:unnamed protein product [Rotaria sp. Silwood1]|nr:unnamed protein product [Rotaria sp. Silwood1]